MNGNGGAGDGGGGGEGATKKPPENTMTLRESRLWII